MIELIKSKVSSLEYGYKEEAMNILPEILHRVSVRKFKSQEIEKEKIEAILEAGRRAPSAKNRQPWRFIVIHSSKLREKILEYAYGEEYIGEAPVIIAACTTNVDYKMPNGQLSYPIDITFAVSFMMLQAEHEGLCSCINTTFNEPLIKELLTVPYSMRIVMLLVLGYPEEKLEPKPRLSLRQIHSYDHW
jgi:nitroreductase